MNITLDDGRTELWQWDTGRKIVVDDKSVSEIHYSKYSSTQAITREVINGKAEIPNFLLQDTHAVTAYAYSGSIGNGYTMAEKTFNVVKKPKPANYVETEEDKAILAKLKAAIGDLSELQTEAKDNLVSAINEAAASGGADWQQNDPDGDGYVKNRPGGYDLVETRKILETTLVSADDDNNIIADADFFLAEGDSVYVSIGGAPEVTHKVSVTTSTGGGPAVLYSFGSKSYDEILAGGFAATDYIVMWYGDGAKWVYMKGAGADLVGKTIVARADVATTVKIPGKYLEFVINATLDSSRQCALDKTFAQIREAVRAGNKPVVHFVMPDGTGTAVMPLVEDYGVIFIFRVTISIDTGPETAIGQYIISINRDDKVSFATFSGLALNSDGNLPQQTIDRDPKQPMQIATKKYVDDHAAASNDFIVNVTTDDNNNCTLDKTFAQIQGAVQAGKNVYAQLNEFFITRMPLVIYNSNMLLFGATTTTYQNLELYALGVTASEARFVFKSAVTYNSDEEMPQVTMAAAPTSDMQIATKKYVDDHAGGGTDMGITGASVGQIAKITAVDASGTPTAWEPADMPSGGGAITYDIAATASHGGTNQALQGFACSVSSKQLRKAIDAGKTPRLVITIGTLNPLKMYMPMTYYFPVGTEYAYACFGCIGEGYPGAYLYYVICEGESESESGRPNWLARSFEATPATS